MQEFWSPGNIMLVDSSYCSFYRYYATILWYKRAHPDTKVDNTYEWHKDKIFMDKYEKIYLNSLMKIKKKFKIPMKNIVFALDCPRDSIWRMPLYPKYKANRKISDKKFNPSMLEVFRWTKHHILPKLVKNYDIKIVRCDKAEADDIVAVLTGHFREQMPDREYLIVTNDYDYLQLLDVNVHIYNLKNKNLREKSLGNRKLDLGVKIIVGDNSDNIPKCFPKCGQKTAIKYVNNPELLDKAFAKYPGSKEKFILNKTLIDFNCIPSNIQQNIIENFEKLE